jgi:hypothetical protein
LRSEEETRDLSASRYDYVIGEQMKTGDNAKLMQGEQAPPVLPPYDVRSPAPARPAPVVPPQTQPEILPPVVVPPAQQ